MAGSDPVESGSPTCIPVGYPPYDLGLMQGAESDKPPS